jgi:hypothetical protein
VSILLFEVISVLVGNALVDLRRCGERLIRVVHILDLNDRRQFLSLFKVHRGRLEVVLRSNVLDTLV